MPPSPAEDAGNAEEPDVVVNHVGLCTTDLDRSTRFYTELLDFAVEEDLELPDEVIVPFLLVRAPANLHARYLRRGSFRLELILFDRPVEPASSDSAGGRLHQIDEQGLTHISLSVEHLEEVLDRTEELGGTVVNRQPFGSLIRDPDGQLLELLPMAYRRGTSSDTPS